MKHTGRLKYEFQINEPAHDKTYNKTCVTSKDSDHPVHPSSMSRVLVYPSLGSLEAVKVTHYENTHIQIYRKIHLQKMKIFR